MSEQLTLVSEQRAFGGRQIRYSHTSSVLNCQMQFSVFLPPQTEQHQVPALYWLSGLTCTDENFSSKAGAQRMAAQLGIALIIPDTSPRGEGVPDDESGAYDFGLGAGFYLNATQAPFDKHYRMYDYIVDELPMLVETCLPLTESRSISGHSMGGHGALVIGLHHPDRYKSISAFAPICHPSRSPWGIKAFRGYLGDDESCWQPYDATLVLAKAENPPAILVDQGTADNFWPEQLLTDSLVAVARQRNIPAEIRFQPGFDHSYYFIASFIEDHLRFHSGHLIGN